MRIHYLFGNRYDISETKSIHDLRHRNAVYSVAENMREFGCNIEFHYCTDSGDLSIDIDKNDIVINLHPQFSATGNVFLEAAADGAAAGVWLDSSDTAALADEHGPLCTTIKKADFVITPSIHHASLVSPLNKRVIVIPPVIETEGRLPSLDLDDVKNHTHPLRMTCIAENENYEGLIRILPDIIRFSHDILPVEITLIARAHTGFISTVTSDTLLQTVTGMTQILSKNSPSIAVSGTDFSVKNVNDALHASDCLLVLPCDDETGGNIQIPLMGLHTGNFTFVPANRKVYSVLSSYGVIPYRPENIADTLKKTLTAPHEVLTGSMADGRRIIRECHNAKHVATLMFNAFKTELSFKQDKSKRKTSGSSFDWNKIGSFSSSPAPATNKQSESV